MAARASLDAILARHASIMGIPSVSSHHDPPSPAEKNHSEEAYKRRSTVAGPSSRERERERRPTLAEGDPRMSYFARSSTGDAPLLDGLHEQAMEGGPVGNPEDLNVIAEAPPPGKPVKLPEQLSPAMLGVLLEDLLEYNGINYRTVPLRTFREKYIGIYFGMLESARCREFLEHLKAFYVVMNHKFECVLVSCDGTEEAYTQHVQLTLWPTYPQGDYRALLLRRHFQVDECPQLVIIDPNGMVVTSNGVAQLEADQMALGFPWCEPAVEHIWGERVQGQLKNILDDLHLPDVNGMEADEFEVVGLLFGELWCPETRDLLRRLAYLLERLQQRRAGPNSSKRRVGFKDNKQSFQEDDESEEDEGSHAPPQGDRVAFYFIHSESVEKYRRFPDFDMPFEMVWLHEESQREALFHFLGVREVPALRIVCADEGWMLRDGECCLRRDPTGILFPWRQQPFEYDEDGLNPCADIIRPLTEDDLTRALCEGPVFVALLHTVRKDRCEALQILRQAAVQHELAMDKRSSEMAVQGELSEMAASGGMCSASGVPAMFGRSKTLKFDEPDDRPKYEDGTSIRDTIVKPPGGSKSIARMMAEREQQAVDHSIFDDQSNRVLWRASQKMGARHELIHGTAPWNLKGDVSKWGHGRISFFYSIAEDRATEVLRKYCRHDAKTLYQHKLWQASKGLGGGVDSENAVQEMKDRLAELQAPNHGLYPPGTHGTGSGAPPTPSGAGGRPVLQLPEDDGGGRAPSKGAPPPVSTGSAYPSEAAKDEKGARLDRAHFQPRAHTAPLSGLTEELLGDGRRSKGTGLIVDMARGAYYVCGSLTDQDTVGRFIDGWYNGLLEPFEVGLLNPDELVKDKEEEVARQMAANAEMSVQGGPWTATTPDPMPAIVIWIPSKRHQESGETPAGLYRALLQYAYRRCPREGLPAGIPEAGTALEREDYEGLPAKNTLERLAPWVEKLWIFGLMEGEDADKEEGMGDWQPAPTEYMSELSQFVNKMVKKQDMEEQRQRTRRATITRGLSQGTSPAGGTAFQFKVADSLVPGSINESRPGSADSHGPIGITASDRPKDMLVARASLDDRGLKVLREGVEASLEEDKFSVLGNYNVCLRTAKTRKALYASMLDEISYHTLVQYPPPPLMVVIAGDLPAGHLLPWPSALRLAHVDLVGSTPDPQAYRDVSPSFTTVDWERWVRNSVDSTISPNVARYIAVPWQ